MELACSYCKIRLRMPVKLGCGHLVCYECYLIINDIYLQGYDHKNRKGSKAPTCPQCCLRFDLDLPIEIDEQAFNQLFEGTEGSCNNCLTWDLMDICQECIKYFCSRCSAHHAVNCRHSVVSTRGYWSNCEVHKAPADAYDIVEAKSKCRDCQLTRAAIAIGQLKADIFNQGPAIYKELLRLKQTSQHSSECYQRWVKNPLMKNYLNENYDEALERMREQLQLVMSINNELAQSLRSYDYLHQYAMYVRYRGQDLAYDPKFPEFEEPFMENSLYYILRGSSSIVSFNFDQDRPVKSSISNKQFNRWSCYVTLPNGYLFITGGKPSKEQGALSHAFYFDPVNIEDIEAPRMIEAHSSHIFIRVGNFVYAVSGKNANNLIHRSAERFNLDTESWESVADISIGRTCAANCNIGDFIYVFGGYETRVENSIERYSISSNSWTLMNLLLPEKMWQASAFPLNSHQILIYGGESNTDDFQRNSFIFDTTDQTFDFYTSIPSHYTFLYFWISTILRDDCLYMMNKAGTILEYSIPRNKWSVYRSFSVE
mmetsp:Transcript_34419/g.60341  ORF Transcript_34419/g.60341 Transcript_34419/m.60341 type:complete len:542 (+) Transcript_34419:727-2352(+)